MDPRKLQLPRRNDDTMIIFALWSMGWRLRENLHRKPSIFPWNMEFSCHFSWKKQSIDNMYPTRMVLRKNHGFPDGSVLKTIRPGARMLDRDWEKNLNCMRRSRKGMIYSQDIPCIPCGKLTKLWKIAVLNGWIKYFSFQLLCGISRS